jgi:hypothetical protein
MWMLDRILGMRPRKTLLLKKKATGWAGYLYRILSVYIPSVADFYDEYMQLHALDIANDAVVTNLIAP